MFLIWDAINVHQQANSSLREMYVIISFAITYFITIWSRGRDSNKISTQGIRKWILIYLLSKHSHFYLQNKNLQPILNEYHVHINHNIYTSYAAH